MYSKYELARVSMACEKFARVPVFMEYNKSLGKLVVAKRVHSASYGHDILAKIFPRLTKFTDYIYVLAPRLDKPKRRNMAE